MAKRGPKPKIDATVGRRILDIIEVGGSLEDAAGIVGVSSSTLRLYKSKNLKFRQGVLEAQKTAKLKLIKKVGKASAWQAAAWMLERKYGSEFGRRETIKQDITTGGKPVHPVVVNFDNDRFAELYRLRTGRDHASAGDDPAHRN